MPGPIKNSSQVMDGVSAYRKVLASSPDKSVNIASIGMTTNLADLLGSKSDQYSTLTGVSVTICVINMFLLVTTSTNTHSLHINILYMYVHTHTV
jgi:hypothetical protein